MRAPNIQRPTSSIAVRQNVAPLLLRCWTVAFFLSVLSLQSGCSLNLLNSLVANDDYHLTSSIPYGQLPRQQLDVYQPKNPKPVSDVVIFFYGGYWSSGYKGSYRFVGEALTQKGFVTVVPDYRIYPSATFPAFVQDGAAAVRWVHDHIREFGGDPDHIYLMGHSAGAHIAALLTLDDRYLKAVGLDRTDIRGTCGLAGPYDFKLDDRTAPIFNLKSAAQPADPTIEPINWVDGRESPMLLVQGTWDTTVDPGNATRLAERIRQKGGDVKLIMYPFQGHVGVVLALAAPFQWLAPVLEDATAFFHSHR